MDESGDPGIRGSRTQAYVIATVLVEDSAWSATLADLVSHRRWLRSAFGIPMRTEIKATQLVQGIGPWSGIGSNRRQDIFRSFMRLQAKTGTIRTFAVVIKKAHQPSTDQVRERAWENALNRLETFSRKNGNALMMLLPDVGEYEYRRKQARRMRRFAMVGSMLGPGSLSRPFASLIEDPVPRRSHESYFIQLADLNAYAAHRDAFPLPLLRPGMWSELGSAVLAAANWHSGGTPGIVVRS